MAVRLFASPRLTEHKQETSHTQPSRGLIQYKKKSCQKSCQSPAKNPAEIPCTEKSQKIGSWHRSQNQSGISTGFSAGFFVYWFRPLISTDVWELRSSRLALFQIEGHGGDREKDGEGNSGGRRHFSFHRPLLFLHIFHMEHYGRDIVESKQRRRDDGKVGWVVSVISCFR